MEQLDQRRELRRQGQGEPVHRVAGDGVRVRDQVGAQALAGRTRTRASGSRVALRARASAVSSLVPRSSESRPRSNCCSKIASAVAGAAWPSGSSCKGWSGANRIG